MPSESTTPRTRWFQFRLSTFFAWTAIIAGLTGCFCFYLYFVDRLIIGTWIVAWLAGFLRGEAASRRGYRTAIGWSTIAVCLVATFVYGLDGRGIQPGFVSSLYGNGIPIALLSLFAAFASTVLAAAHRGFSWSTQFLTTFGSKSSHHRKLAARLCFAAILLLCGYGSVWWLRTPTPWHPSDMMFVGEIATEGLAVSPDGKTLAVGLANGSVELWDVAKRTRIGPWQLNLVGNVTMLRFSQDGQRLLCTSRSDRQTIVCQLNPWKEIAVLKSATTLHHAQCQWIANDEQVLTVALHTENDRGYFIAHLWDTDFWTEVRQFKFKLDSVGGELVVYPERRLAAFFPYRTNGLVHSDEMWDLESNQILQKLPRLKSFTALLAGAPFFSPDGTLLVDHVQPATLWDLATGESAHLSGRAWSFTPDGNRLIISESRRYVSTFLPFAQKVKEIPVFWPLFETPPQSRLVLYDRLTKSNIAVSGWLPPIGHVALTADGTGLVTNWKTQGFTIWKVPPVRTKYGSSQNKTTREIQGIWQAARQGGLLHIPYLGS